MRKRSIFTIVFVFLGAWANIGIASVDEKAFVERIQLKFTMYVNGYIEQFYKNELYCGGFFSEVDPLPKRNIFCKKLVEGDPNKIATLQKFILSQRERAFKLCKPGDYESSDISSELNELYEKHCSEANFKVGIDRALPLAIRDTKKTLEKNKDLIKSSAKGIMSAYWSCPRNQSIYKCKTAIKNYITAHGKFPKSHFERAMHPEFDLSPSVGVVLDTNTFKQSDISQLSPHKACSIASKPLKTEYFELFNDKSYASSHKAVDWVFGAFWHCLYHANKIQESEVKRIEKILLTDSGMNKQIDNTVEYRDHLNENFFADEFEKKIITYFSKENPEILFDIDKQKTRVSYLRNGHSKGGWEPPTLGYIFGNSIFTAMDLAEKSLLIDLEKIKSIQLYERIARLEYTGHAYGGWAIKDPYILGSKSSKITDGYRRKLGIVDNWAIAGRIAPTLEQEKVLDQIGFALYEMMRSRMLEINELIQFDFILKSGSKRIKMADEFSRKASQFAHVKEMYSWISKKDTYKLFVIGNGENNRAKLESEGYHIDKAGGKYFVNKIDLNRFFKDNSLRREQYVQHENSSSTLIDVVATNEDIAADPSLSPVSVFSDSAIEVENDDQASSGKKNVLVPIAEPINSVIEVAATIKKLVKSQIATFSELCVEIIPVGLNSNFSQENSRAFYVKCSEMIDAGKVNCEGHTNSCNKIKKIERINRQIASLQEKLP